LSQSTPAPPRGYSWPPFEEGNSAALTHGAFSPRKVNPLAEQIAGVLLTQGPSFLRSPEYGLAVWGLARTEARIQTVSEWLDEHGELDDEGLPRPAGSLLLKLERLAAEHRSRLGLDPSSRVRIERDLASVGRDLNLAAAIQEGQRIRAEAEQRINGQGETAEQEAKPRKPRPRRTKAAAATQKEEPVTPEAKGLTAMEQGLIEQAEALARNGVMDPFVRGRVEALLGKATKEADRKRIEDLLEAW
jgi:hypothetical protein